MLKLTLKNIWKIKLLPDEKKGLVKLLEKTSQDWYELYLFGSRLNGWWVDIDLIIKPDPGFKRLLKYQTLFNLYSDTKLDLVPYNQQNLSFIKSLSSKITQC